MRLSMVLGAGVLLASIDNATDVPLILQAEVLAPNVNGGLGILPRTPRLRGKDMYANADSSARIRPRAWAAKTPVIKMAKP